MTYTYSITIGHHFKNAKGILIFLIIFSLGPYYLIYKHGYQDVNLYYFGCLGLFLLFLVPQMAIHLRFYLLNKGRTFFYLPDQQRMSLMLKSGRTIQFSFDDIKRVERSKSIPLAENRAHWFPWDNYNYSVIYLKDGQQFVITSLLVPNMDLPLDESKIKLRKRFYCYPFGAKEVLET